MSITVRKRASFDALTFDTVEMSCVEEMYAFPGKLPRPFVVDTRFEVSDSVMGGRDVRGTLGRLLNPATVDVRDSVEMYRYGGLARLFIP